MISKMAWAYCCEDLSLIENYDKAISDDTQTWRCHHRLEIQDEGKLIYTPKQLENLGLYYNRPASELIFLTLSEHNTLHGKYAPDERNKRRSDTMKGKSHPQSKETREYLSKINTGKTIPKEVRNKISNALKGRKCTEKERIAHSLCWTEEMKQEVSKRFKGKPKSEETKRRMSESAKKYISSNKNYALEKSNSIKQSEKYKSAMAKRKGEKVWNNGVVEVRALTCPIGFVQGKLSLSEEHKKHMSASIKGKKWWNDGVVNARAKECPDGFVPGRLKK